MSEHSMMLLLKLLFVPACVITVSLASRHWGPLVGGALGGAPIVTGPILLIVALEQGPVFASQAAVASLAAVGAVIAFSLSYTWAAYYCRWQLAMIVGMAGWLAAALLLKGIQAAEFILPASGVAGAALVIAKLVLPKCSLGSINLHFSATHLIIRAVSGAMLTLLVTLISNYSDPTWSGLLAVFPVVSIVVAAFSQRNFGSAFVAGLFRGMAMGLYSFAAFCLTLSLLLPVLGVASAFIVALGASLIVQTGVQLLIVVLTTRTPKPLSPSPSPSPRAE